MIRGFASDNYSGVHPAIMEAILSANVGHVPAYGDDPYTRSAKARFKEHFGDDIDVYFVFNGTGANVLGLKAATRSHHSIICAKKSHINLDECGAPEAFSGAKLLPVKTDDGKIDVEGIKEHMFGFGFQHHSQPKVISITQASEAGTVYTPGEIRKIADFAHENNMFLHMDGARLANAAASLGVELREITGDAGVDILSFGGAKNGMMFGEAVLFFDPEISGSEFKYIRKQGMQLASKMRFISAQFEALLSNDLWRKNAAHANEMARLLAEKTAGVSGIKITQKVQANGVFATMDKQQICRIQEDCLFYVWDEGLPEVRWMTSFDTTPKDVHDFSAYLEKTLMAS